MNLPASVDPAALLAAAADAAMLAAQAIERRTEAVRTRGSLTHAERARLQVWAADLDVAFRLLSEARAAAKYLSIRPEE